MKVYKYPIPVEDRFTLRLPKGAQVLDVQAQSGKPQLWALVDADQHTTQRTFILRGTGHSIGNSVESLRYCGTFQLHDEELVFHVFEVV